MEDHAFERSELIPLISADGPCEFSLPSPSVRQRPDCWFCPLSEAVAARDIFMRCCETSNSSIWGCYPSPTFFPPSLISYRPLTSCKKWMRHQISFSRLAFLLLLRPTRDPIRSLCQLRHHINMPHNPSFPPPHCARLVLIWPGMSSGKK